MIIPSDAQLIIMIGILMFALILSVKWACTPSENEDELIQNGYSIIINKTE